MTLFHYVGSIVATHVGFDLDIQACIGKAIIVCNMLDNIWKSLEIPAATEVQIFFSNFKSVLMYGNKAGQKYLRSIILTCINKLVESLKVGDQI